MIRKASTFNTARIDHIYDDPHESDAKLFLHYGDLSNLEQISNVIYNIRPDEVYNLGAQSHVQVSFEMPEYTGEVTGLGTTRLLEAIRRSGIEAKFYQASSSELFGSTLPPQNENSPFAPRSPYAIAKLYSYWMTVNYRDGYGTFATNGILFNHESPRRGETFVTRKVTRAVARIKAGLQDKLFLGNMDAKRDWGYAPEYVEVMWELMQLEEPDDYVIGIGESHSVREFVEEAFSYAGLDWEKHVEIDPRYFRPTEVAHLEADASKAREAIGWSPKVRFHELTRIMMDAELEAMGMKPVGEGVEVVRERFDGWHQWGSAKSGMGTGMLVG
jgi:GDPmannose 4,6-dehydratase